jgi:hypothetical protein
MAWNPLSVADLPGFVYDWAKSGPSGERALRLGIGGKSVFQALQRMETPVIYFYSDEPLTVSAHVNFPLGTMTEWYPKAKLPGAVENELRVPTALHWDNIQVYPTGGSGADAVKVLPMPPNDSRKSHYYAARETDADLLQVNGETEKFLFYRGVGSFRAPLTVTQSGDDADALVLQNTGPLELRHLFVYQVNAQGGRYLYVPSVPAGKSREVKLDEKTPFVSPTDVRDSLGSALEKALTREGLYEREARAMVKTWDDSWFGERGVRVLYTLPGQWADKTLPLTLEPKPAEIVRVMIGRAELITPRMEWDLMREIVRFGGGTAAEKELAVAGTRALGLGRFLEPTVRRLTSRLPSKSLSTHASELLAAASKPTQAPAGKRLASN